MRILKLAAFLRAKEILGAEPEVFNKIMGRLGEFSSNKRGIYATIIYDNHSQNNVK
jgi:hypothetical protein